MRTCCCSVWASQCAPAGGREGRVRRTMHTGKHGAAAGACNVAATRRPQPAAAEAAAAGRCHEMRTTAAASLDSSARCTHRDNHTHRNNMLHPPPADNQRQPLHCQPVVLPSLECHPSPATTKCSPCAHRGRAPPCRAGSCSPLPPPTAPAPAGARCAAAGLHQSVGSQCPERRPGREGEGGSSSGGVGLGSSSSGRSAQRAEGMHPLLRSRCMAPARMAVLHGTCWHVQKLLHGTSSHGNPHLESVVEQALPPDRPALHQHAPASAPRSSAVRPSANMSQSQVLWQPGRFRPACNRRPHALPVCGGRPSNVWPDEGLRRSQNKTRHHLPLHLQPHPSTKCATSPHGVDVAPVPVQDMIVLPYRVARCA